MHSQNKTKKSHAKLFLMLVFLVAIAGLVYAKYDFMYDVVVGFNYVPEEEIATVIDNIDLTGEGQRILKASRPELQSAADFNKNCPTVSAQTSTLGCYYARQIYVYDIDNEELNGIKEAVLAHELLHAVWERMSDREKAHLEPILRQVYEDNQDELSEHMDNYEAGDFVDELHSAIGTQLDVSKLGSELRNHYAEYFNDSAKIVAYFKGYDDILTGQRKEAEKLYIEIQARKAEIDARTATYQQNFDQLNADIDDYNARAAIGWTTYAERDAFNAERNQLLTRQSLLDNEYQALADYVDATNELVDQYNAMVEHLGQLQQSIDSNAEKLPTPAELTN
jgi:hypothetical protein